MCDRPKIHVFLGAPPPSSGPASLSDSGVEGEDRPSAACRQLELTWMDGHLRPAIGEAFRDPTVKMEKQRVLYLNDEFFCIY